MSNSLFGWKSIRQELMGNDRLRWGLWCIAGLSLFYVILILKDAYGERELKVQQLSSQLVELSELATESVWQGRLDEVNLQAEVLESRFWHARTDGLARAALQGTMEQLAREAGMVRVSVRVSSPVKVEGLSDVMKIRLEISGGFISAEAFALLRSLEKQQPVMLIESSQINWNAGTNNLSMQVVALVKLEEPV